MVKQLHEIGSAYVTRRSLKRKRGQSKGQKPMKQPSKKLRYLQPTIRNKQKKSREPCCSNIECSDLNAY